MILNQADVLQGVIIGKEVEVIAPIDWEGQHEMAFMSLTEMVTLDQDDKELMMGDLMDQEGIALKRAVIMGSTMTL